MKVIKVIIKGVPLVGNSGFMVFDGEYLENYTLRNLIVWPGRLIEPKSHIPNFK